MNAPTRERCAHRGCTDAPRNRAGFLCADHWFALPRELRDKIWAAYRTKDRTASGALVLEALRYLRDRASQPRPPREVAV